MLAEGVPNPFTRQSWSPYAVGLGLGVLSWFAFYTADKHLAITLQYEHIAAMLQAAVSPQAVETNGYYAARASACRRSGAGVSARAQPCASPGHSSAAR